MVLAIGLLVDDAIVVVENVERVMREEPGISAREATIRSMDEIQTALIAIALVLSAVFLPMAFFGGSVGQIYRQFSDHDGGGDGAVRGGGAGAVARAGGDAAEAAQRAARRASHARHPRDAPHRRPLLRGLRAARGSLSRHRASGARSPAAHAGRLRAAGRRAAGRVLAAADQLPAGGRPGPRAASIHAAARRDDAAHDGGGERRSSTTS